MPNLTAQARGRAAIKNLQKALVAAALTALIAIPKPATAQQTCEIAYCLGGLLQNIPSVIKGNTTCQQLLCNSYYSSAFWKFTPHYNAFATQAARYAALLSQCPDVALVRQIEASNYSLMQYLPACVSPQQGGGFF